MAEIKSKMVSMRLTEAQFAFLESVVKRVRQKSGFRITRASIILKLMELGLEQFEREYLNDQSWDKTGS